MKKLTLGAKAMKAGLEKGLSGDDLDIYLCRRKTLCFSCRDIRRHPCPCANTRANIGLPPAGRVKIFSTQLHII